MKNLHYDLVNLLHSISDIQWRIDKHYLNDAKECGECEKLFKKIRDSAEETAGLLAEEIARHGKLE